MPCGTILGATQGHEKHNNFVVQGQQQRVQAQALHTLPLPSPPNLMAAWRQDRKRARQRQLACKQVERKQVACKQGERRQVAHVSLLKPRTQVERWRLAHQGQEMAPKRQAQKRQVTKLQPQCREVARKQAEQWQVARKQVAHRPLAHSQLILDRMLSRSCDDIFRIAWLHWHPSQYTLHRQVESELKFTMPHA